LISLLAVLSGGCAADGVSPMPTLSDIEIRLENTTVPAGSATQAFAILKDAQGRTYTVAGDTVSWRSSNQNVATIDPNTGVVTAVAPGTSTIEATMSSKSGSTTLTVVDAPVVTMPVASISLSIQSPFYVGQTIGAVAVMKDADGNRLSGRAATWISTDPSVANVSQIGVVTGLTPGNAIVRVTSEGITAEAPVQVIAEATPSASLDVQVQPGGAVSGSPFATQPVIQILDSEGGVTTSANVPVTAALASGNGTLSGTTTVNAVDGVATFTNLTIKGTGSHVLTFSTTSPSLSVASSSFTVATASATQLVVTTQPSATAQNGVAFARQPAVQIRDASGNAVAQSGIVVTASIASGGGTLGGSTTAATNADGEATFADLSISGAAGARTLRFSSGGLTGATSSAISVSAALSTTQAVPSASGVVSQPVTAFVPVVASGGQTPYTYAISEALPSGMTFDQKTGTVAGTPTTTLATKTFTVTVKDASSQSSSKTFQLTVTAANAPLATAVAVASQAGDVARAVATFAPVTASGGTTPYTFALSGGRLPAGMTFDASNGQIGGTPSAALATTTFKVTVTDAASQTSSKTFQLTIAPELTTEQVVAKVTSTVNRPIATFTPVTASGGTTPYTFAISGGSLPAGMSFNTATGAVSGTPTGTLTSGRTYTVTATDAIGATSSKTFVIVITSALTTTQAVSSRSVTVNQALTAFTPVTASGGTAPYSYALSGALPSGVSFNTSTGQVSGTPTAVLSTTSYTVTVTDASGATSSKAFSLTVNAVATDTQAPTLSISSPTSSTSYSTTATSVALQGSASDNAAVAQVTWSNDRGGSGTATGTTSWSTGNIALQTGTNVITVTARDAANNVATKSLTVTVDQPGGTTSPADLASNNFDGNTFTPPAANGVWRNETPGNSIIDDPTGAGRGKVFKNVFADVAPNGFADINHFISYAPSSGLGHGSTTWFRGDVYFPKNTVNFTEPNTLRKLTYWRTGEGGTNQCDFVIGMFGNQAFLSIVVPGTTDIMDWNIFSINAGQWYRLELEVHFNSAPGVADGSVSVYLDGTKVRTRTGVAFTRPSDPASKQWIWLAVGHQREGNGKESSISEERYWDNVAFSTKRISP